MPSKDQIIKLNDDYEDALFRLVVNNAAEEEGKQLLKDNEQLHSSQDDLPSAESMKAFTKLLDAHLKKEKKVHNKAHFSNLNKAAVAVLTIVVLFSTMMLSVQALRVKVLNFLISIQSEYTSFKLEDDDQTAEKLIVDWKNAYVPTYIPKGYSVTDMSYSDAIKKITLDSEDNKTSIIYTQFESGSISIDTENASLIETIKINDQDGTLSIKDATTTVVWKMDNHLFIVQGQISRKEAIKIAESVKFIE